MSRWPYSIVVMSWIVFGAPFGLPAEEAAVDPNLFEAKIRPLFAQHCQECHGAEQQESGLRLDTYEGMLKGGEIGPAVVPGKTNLSLIVAAVGYGDEALQMPPSGKLPQEAIDLIRQWVEHGALHPDKDKVALPTGTPAPKFDVAEARSFWSFQPIVRPAVPATKSDWGTSDLDKLLLADLEQHGLSPAPPAERRDLLRRATFDLTGLPPTPVEMAAFLADESPESFARVVDRLLDSQAYGERWGRHWLDVVRYADSNGLDENIAHGNAWRYRDYVIAAFNQDKPFDRFLMEQIAGDLLEEDPATFHERLVATGFLTLGAKVLAEGDETKLQMDIIDEQIDTIGKSILGMTLGCARCHDHKFDPIATADYYALAGIFKSTRTMESLKRIAKWNENVIASAEQLAAKKAHDERIAAKKSEIESVVKTANAALTENGSKEVPKDAETMYPEETKQALVKLRDELKGLEKAAPELPTAMGVADAEATRVPIHVRGSHLTLGQEVDRGIPVVWQTEPVSFSEKSSGRLEFAKWLTGPQNPLTARVMANRLWRWHFGRGLVGTVDNFGRLGERPVNQPLLDWLAAELIESGWSMKSMHRRIMLTQTYKMSSGDNPDCSAIDPGNVHHWRADVRRLEAEAIRDSLLAVSGQLDAKMGGSLLHVANREFIFNHTSKDETKYDALCRSVYLPVIRNNLYDGFSLFDYTDAAVPNGDRGTSTVAPQALFMMNSDLVLTAAEKLARRLLDEGHADDAARFDRLYQLAFGRLPGESERARMAEFLTRLHPESPSDPAPWTALCQVILAGNEFLYVK